MSQMSIETRRFKKEVTQLQLEFSTFFEVTFFSAFIMSILICWIRKQFGLAILCQR